MPKDTPLAAEALTRHAVIDGTPGDETLSGTSAADTISGLDGIDVIEAGAGDDSVLGGTDADLINGDAGNDTLDGEGGDDTLVGGAGDDTFVLSVGSDAYFGEQVQSTILDGLDVLDMSTAGLGLNVLFSGVGRGTVASLDHDSRFFGIEEIIGSGLDDVIRGAGGNDVFAGGDGNDLLAGGAGNDDLSGGAGDDTLLASTGADTLAGGDGGDLLSGEELVQGMTLILSGAGIGALTLDNGDVTGFDGIETIRGSSRDDVLTGAEGNDVFEAGGGDDLVQGGGGADVLTGAAGADTLSGGAGNDEISGGAGDDVIDGGAGFDTVILPETPSRAVIFLREDGSLRVLSEDGDDIYSNIEMFRFDGGVEVPVATMQAIAVPEPAPIDGTDAADTINGLDGIDVIEAGAGDDSVLGGGGADLVNGGAGNDTLDGEAGNDTLVGGAGDDTFVLSVGSDAYFGEQVDSTVAVAEGLDVLDMGAAATGLNVAFTDVGIGTVESADHDTRFFGIERIIGSDLDDTIRGAGGDDIFAGGAGADLLAGGAGDDDLLGNAGDDTLLVGTGDDTLSGGAGTDLLSGEELDQAMTLLLLGGGSGELTLDDGSSTGFDGIEVIRGSALNDTMTGAASDDIFEGAGGDDVIDGGAGFDTVILPETPSRADIFLREDGSLRIVSADGDDIYSNIESFRFAGGVEVPVATMQAIAAPEPEGGGTTVPEGDATPLTGVRAPVGDEIASLADPAIGDALFGTANTALQSITYEGSPDAIGLLPEGYTVTDGAISVGIQNGIFLTTGGGPGTQNTVGNFGENLGTPGNALLDQAVAAAFEDAGGTNDAAVLTFTFDSSLLADQTTLALNVFFGSDEYPEFADSSFVDIAAVYVNGVNYALFNNDPGQPLSIVGESINTPGNFFTNVNDTFDTEYDGISALLTVLAPVIEGTNTVTVGIADTGDSIYDSGLWVGNLAGSDITAFGSFVNVPGTEGNDVFDLNIAPQIVDLVGGRDLVRGNLETLDNDVINGWGDNDLLLWQEAFDPSTVSVTADSEQAEVVVDLNGDGTPESRTLIFGNFSQAEFFIEAVDGGVQLYTIGVLPDPPVFLVGTDDGDVLRGGTGNDQLSGGLGQDTLGGGEGADTLAGGAGDDLIDGDFGADSIGGGFGDDTIYGGDSADIIGGGMGNDSILGGQGRDFANGGAGDDLLDGESGNDTIGGGFGADSVYGGLGDDSLGGGTGQDYLFGGRGDDTLGGGEGDDLVEDSFGANFLAGGGRNDTVIGGQDSDTINGGSGDDVLMGGAGADVFVFNDPRDGELDKIVDFEVGIDSLRFTGGNVAAVDISFAVIDDLPGLLLELGGHQIHLLGLIESDFDTADMIFV